MQYISDINMIKAIDFVKESGMVSFKKECYDVMGLDANKVHKIRFPEKYSSTRSNHFTVEQIRIFCETYGISANYIFGLEEKMLRNKKLNKSFGEK